MSAKACQVGAHLKALNKGMIVAPSKLIEFFGAFRVSLPYCKKSLKKTDFRAFFQGSPSKKADDGLGEANSSLPGPSSSTRESNISGCEMDEMFKVARLRNETGTDCFSICILHLLAQTEFVNLSHGAKITRGCSDGVVADGPCPHDHAVCSFAQFMRIYSPKGSQVLY